MVENINTPKGVASLEGLNTTQADAEQLVTTDVTTTEPTQEVTPTDTLVPETLPVEQPVQEEPVATLPEPQQSQITDFTDTTLTDVERSIEKDPHVNTLKQALTKYSNDNRAKAMLLSQIDTDPDAILPALASGIVTTADLQQHRISLQINDSQQKLQALESAWIKAPEDNLFKAGANVILQGLTGAGNAILAIPDVVITHGAVMAQEPQNDTDRAYQTYLLGREKTRELYLASQDKTLPKSQREQAQADFDALNPIVSDMYGKLKSTPEFERTEEKYLTGYYEDNATNFIGSFRQSLSGIANHEATNEVANAISDSFNDNLDVLTEAKRQLDNGNLLQATGSLFAGLAGLTSDTVEAMVANPRAILDITAQSFGMMAAGGLVGKGLGTAATLAGGTAKTASIATKFGQVFNYQSMFAADAYQQFEQEYGHLPDAQKAILLNGVTTVAAVLALGGDEYMLNSIKKLAARPKQLKNTAIKDVLSGTTRPEGLVNRGVAATSDVLTSRTLTGAATETIQEFTENLAVQYAGLQDLDKIDLQSATVEALMASGAGGLTGFVGDLGTGLRRAYKGTIPTRLADAKAGYTVQRNEITDLASAQEVANNTVRQMNDVDASLERDEEGTVLNTQANTTAVAGLYDTVIGNLAGLDSALAGIQAADTVSLRKNIEDGIRAGKPLNDVIKEVVGDLEGFNDPNFVLQQLQANPNVVESIQARMASLNPEQRERLGSDIGSLVGTISSTVNQIMTSANQLVSTYDLDEMAAGERAQYQATKAAQKAKVKQAKAKQVSEKAMAENDVASTQDGAKTKAKSKLTVSDVLADFDPNLATVDNTVEQETTVDEAVDATEATDTTEATAEDIDAALTPVEGDTPTTRLNSPSVDVAPYTAEYNATNKSGVPLSSKSGNLQAFDKSINAVLAKLETEPTPKDAKIYVGAVNNLAKELAVLSAKPSLTPEEQTNAATLTRAIATYVDVYASTPNTDNRELGLLLGKNGIKFNTVTKALAAKGVSQSGLPKLFNLIQTRANAGTTAAPTQSKAIDRPAVSVTSTKRLGVHTTDALKALKVPDVFSILNGLTSNLLNGSIEGIPQELMDDVLSVMTASPAEFDSLYTTLTGTNVNYAKERKARFTNVSGKATQEQVAANAYLALAEYFHRVDPQHRDLTYVLSKYLPEVNNALNTKLQDVTIPSEFSSDFNKKAKELVYKELPTAREELPTVSSELAGMLGSGLDAVQIAGKGDELVDYLINEEQLSPTGNIVSNIRAYLADIESNTTLPVALINPTMVSRINTFVNQNTLPNTVKDADISVDAQWAGNVYSGIKEALSRLQLSSDKMRLFTTPDTMQGGMYQVFNMFSVLENPEHENYERIVSSFTSAELEQLRTALPYIQAMRNMYSHMYASNDKLDVWMQNNRAIDLFESMASSSNGADNFMHPNLSAIIAQTALEYAMSDGVLDLGLNKQESIDAIVGNKALAQRDDIRNALASGSTVRALAPRLGKQIVRRLAITANKSLATPADLAQLENSVGHIALLGLEKLGFIKAETVYFKRSGKDVSVHTQDGFGEVKGVQGNDVFRMYSFNDDYITSLDTKHGNVFQALSVSKSLSQKLYGKEDKAGIATEPTELNVMGGNAALNDIARKMAEKSPQYLHRGKLAVFNNLGSQLQQVMFGGGIDTTKVHTARLKAVQAKNRKALADIGRVASHATELEQAGTNKFYMHQIVGGNTRFTGHNPKGIDPVGSSASRFLVNVEERSDIVIGSDNANDIAVENMFYKGMLQALKMAKPEEISEERAKELFDTLATNSDVLRAVALVNVAKTQELSEAESTELSNLLAAIKGESVAHTLDAVWAYSNYLDAYTDGTFSFDATMFMEIDGKNNGSALGIMQNAPISDLEDFKRMAKSVGLNFEMDGGISFGEMKATTEGFLDAYQHLAKAAGDYGNELTKGNVGEDVAQELLGDDYKEIANRAEGFIIIMRLLAGESGALVIDDEVTDEGRGLFKQVLMTVLYGAGVAAQDRYFANKIVSNHLKKMEKFANREDTVALRAEVQEYFNTLASLHLPTRMVAPDMAEADWQSTLLTEAYALKSWDINELTGQVTNTIGLTYRKALDSDTYKNIIIQASSAVESSNVAHLRLHFAVQRLLAKYKADNGIEGDLTVEQNDDFKAKVIAPLIPKLSYPLAAVDGSGTKGIKISSDKNTRQHIPQSAYDSAQAALDAAKADNPNFKGTRDQFLPAEYRKQIVQDFLAGTNTTLVSQILSRVLEAPELMVAPSGVHAQDSSIQTYVSQGDVPFLNVYDAQGGTPKTMASMQGKGNEAFNAVTSNYNLYSDLVNTYQTFDAMLAEQLSAEELASVDTELANALGLPDFNYGQYMSDIAAAYTAINARATAMKSALVSIDQYPMTSESPYIRGDVITNTLDDIQPDHVDSLDLDKFPSILGAGRVAEGRNLALSSATFAETDTDNLRDVLSVGSSMYSTTKATVGDYVASTLRNAVSQMREFAGISNPKASKALRELANEIERVLGDTYLAGRLVLPKLDVNNLDAEILKYLHESDMTASAKKLLTHEHVIQLLKNNSPELIEAGVYTESQPLNLWLSLGDNIKWLNAPIGKLLSDEFFNTIRETGSVVGIDLAPIEVVRNLVLSPASRSYIGKEVRGEANQLISNHMLEYVSKLTESQFGVLLEDAGVWGNVKSVTALNSALLLGIIQNPKGRSRDWYIEDLNRITANPKLSKAYFGGIASRIVNLHKKRGDFTSGNLTPAIVKQSVLNRIMPAPVISTDAVPVNVAPESNMDIEYTDTGMQVSYMGHAFPLLGTGIKVYDMGQYMRISYSGDLDVSHIFDATGGQLKAEKTAKGTVVISPVLGTPTFNNQNQNNSYNEIASEDVITTYDAVVAQSVAKDSVAHASHLRELVNTISNSLQQVKLRIADVTNAATSGYFMNNVITVDINKLLPRSVTNFMSAGETIAHEYVHAISSNIAEINPRLSAKAYELYYQAKRTITWQDLLDPNLHPDDAEVVAKRLYSYMFEDNITETTKDTVTTKVTKTRKESTRVAEFIALATTNENVARALDKIAPKSREYTGFTAKVIQLFNAVLATLFRKVNSGMEQASIHREMVDIIYTLAKLQNNHQSIVGSGIESISNLTTKALNATDDAARELLRRTTEFSLSEFVSGTPVLGDKGSFTNPKSYLAAAAGTLSLYGRWDEVKAKANKQIDRIGLFKNRTIRDLVTELSENTKDVNIIHDLISRRTQVIDAARQKTEAEITKYIEKGMFSIPMSEQVGRALTHAVITTDFNKLVKVFGADKALDILHVDNKRLHSLRKQYQTRLKAFKHSDYYINHAKALGESMVNGNSIYYGVHSNAYSIARLAGDEAFGSVETAHVDEITEIVDVLASLYAVMNVAPNERMRARNFLLADNTNRKENNLDSSELKHVGLLSLLNVQESAAKVAFEKNFYSNPQLMQKGYIRETYNPNTEVIVAELDEVESYNKQGFDIVGNLPTGTDTQSKVLMVNHYSARLNYDQGAFSHTGFSQKGTKVSDDLLGITNEPSLVLTSAGRKTMEDARKSMFTNSPIVVGQNSVSIAPVRNDDGAVVGYRYTMSTETKERVLQREDRVSHVLARTMSSVEDKANSQVHNIAVLKELYKMYNDEYAENPNAFVFVKPHIKEYDIEGKLTNPPTAEQAEYAEMWAMLPSYTRAMINVINSQTGLPENVLPVPKKLLTLTFGSAPLTLDKLNKAANINTKVAVSALTGILKNKYGRMVSAAYKEALSGAKDTMVIKSVTTTIDNIVSNFFALSIAGIPMAYTTRKTVQGWKEILQYQQLTQELGKLNSRLMYTPMSSAESAKLKSYIADVEGRISSLSITQLVDEGLYQTIVEDVDTEVGKQTYQSEMSKLGNHLLSMTGKGEKALKEGVFITHDSMTYRYLRDAAQLSDFVARYVMFSHMLEEGKSVEEAVHESRETFILYDAPLSKPLKHLNDLGFFNFSKFLLRTQGVLHKNIRRSPARVLLFGSLWALMGGASATIDVLLTPFNFLELLSNRMQLNPLGFIRNGVTELPIIKLLD